MSPGRKHSANPYIISTTSPEHISNTESDFISIQTIDPDSVKLRLATGSRLEAIGRGDVELKLASGKNLFLRDVLYVPEAETCFFSFHRLTQDLGGACLQTTVEGSNLLSSSGELLATASLHPKYGLPALDLENAIDISPSNEQVVYCLSVFEGV